MIIDFLKNAKDMVCSWGSKVDGICQTMRAYNINYSVKKTTPNKIEYNYKNSVGMLINGIITI